MSGIGNSIGREAIYSAFYRQVSPLLLAAGIAWTGRRPVTEAGLGECQYPAVFFMEAGEIYDRTVLFAPAKVSLLMNLTIVSMQGEIPDESNVTQLNNLADLVESAIQSACESTAQNILGGLVQEAWINHRTQVITGSYAQRISKQIFMVEMILPHSR